MIRRNMLLWVLACTSKLSFAATLACFNSYTLAQLAGNSVQCSLEGTTLEFANFSISGGTITGSGNGVAVPPSAMLLGFTVDSTNTQNSFNPGISVFLHAGRPVLATLGANQEYSVTFQYDVLVLSGGVYGEKSGAIAPYCGPEPTCLNSWSMVTDVNTPQGSFVGDGNAGHSATPPDISHSPTRQFGPERMNLTPPETVGFTIRTSLSAITTGTPSQVDTITNAFIVPEPPTRSLIGLALMVSGLYSWFFRRRRLKAKTAV